MADWHQIQQLSKLMGVDESQVRVVSSQGYHGRDLKGQTDILIYVGLHKGYILLGTYLRKNNLSKSISFIQNLFMAGFYFIEF